jgi:hypothetical protein
MKMKPYGAAGLEVDCTANLGRPGVDALQHDSKAGGAWRKRRNVPVKLGKELQHVAVPQHKGCRFRSQATMSRSTIRG